MSPQPSPTGCTMLAARLGVAGDAHGPDGVIGDMTFELRSRSLSDDAQDQMLRILASGLAAEAVAAARDMAAGKPADLMAVLTTERLVRGRCQELGLE